MLKNDRIIITGGDGMVGSAIGRKLESMGFDNVWKPSRRSDNPIDLSDPVSIKKIKEYKPKYIFHAAAKVGGIVGNSTYPADFGMENSIINNAVINLAFETNSKLLFLGSSCIYPKECPQPIKEEYLLSSYLEPTNGLLETSSH